MPSKFQRRHYEEIARVIRNYPTVSKPASHDEEVEMATVERIVEKLTLMFSDDNGKFQQGRFIKKCGWHDPAL